MIREFEPKTSLVDALECYAGLEQLVEADDLLIVTDDFSQALQLYTVSQPETKDIDSNLIFPCQG